jgi:hypothetical protein
MAEFATPAGALSRCEQVSRCRVPQLGHLHPFPIHGMEEAMGVKRTILPVLVACGGFTAQGLGFLMQCVDGREDYTDGHCKARPFFSRGRPSFPSPSNCGILFAAFTCHHRHARPQRLAPWHHPLFKKERVPR